ncbi:MAG: branched-chain amino acid ABC transporter permease [Rhizobiaceae bacterium]|nr:branched-chain amino acid ABC transporter permease [Rhizobiaceae bacterium]
MTAYLINLAVLTCIYSILAVTLNFIIGYAGIFSVAHAVFFAIGAYTGALIAIHYSTSIFILIPAAMLVTGVVSLVLALPALRVRGEYFVAAALGLQMVAVTVFSQWKSVTGGFGGLIGIPPATVFGFSVQSPVQVLVLALVILLLVMAAIRQLVRSSFGRSLMAIRDSESAAAAVGKNVPAIKTAAVVISASLASTAGVVYAVYISFINVESFTLDMSVLIMAMVIIGGAGTLIGPIVGAAVLMAVPAALTYLHFLPSTDVGSFQQLLYGLAMTLLMIFRPGGIAGKHKRSGENVDG